jgi:hypothetical protein
MRTRKVFGVVTIPQREDVYSQLTSPEMQDGRCREMQDRRNNPLEKAHRPIMSHTGLRDIHDR